MVPWDVIVTGAVGIAGIGGTILATRMTGNAQTRNLLVSIDAENKRAHIAEKRRIYAEFLATVDTEMKATLNYRRIKGQGVSGEEKDAAFDELMRAGGVMMEKSMELKLIAPRDIRLLVASLVDAYFKYAMDTFDGATELVKVEESTPVSVIIDSMRADLGDD